MDEFGLIARYFRPLSLGHDGALQLTDDAALLTPPPGCQLAVTKDAISAGVHFIGTEDPAWIAKKLLRVNLSDLAAMGATPLVYFLACILPKDTTEAWIARFTEGLREDQAEFAIHLAGGDTISTHGPLSLSNRAVRPRPQTQRRPTRRYDLRLWHAGR
jgi:thiamine-monophosphate kinase